MLQDNFSCLQVKCLRVLQYFPVPDDPAVRKALESVLKRIITGMLLFASHTLHLVPAAASPRLSLRTDHNISTVGSGHTNQLIKLCLCLLHADKIWLTRAQNHPHLCHLLSIHG